MQGPGSLGVVSQIIIGGGGPVGGLFLYNGAPATGNPPVLWGKAPGVIADPFGNSLGSATTVLGVGTTTAQSIQIGSNATLFATGTDGHVRWAITPVNGCVMQFFNDFAATTTYIDPINSAIWEYIDTGSATQGRLSIAIAGKASTDPLDATAVNAGFTIFSSSAGAKLWLDTSPANGMPGMSFFTGRVIEVSNAAIHSLVFNAGAVNEALSLNIDAPAISTSGHGDHPYIQLQSAAKDGSCNGMGILQYVTPSAAQIPMFTWTIGGLGGSTDSGFGGGIDLTELDQFTRATGNTVVHTAITRSYSIPANSVYVNGTMWELVCFGNLTTGAVVNQAGFELVAFGVTMFSRGVTPPVAANTTLNWYIKYSWISGTGAAAPFTASMFFNGAQSGVSFTAANTISGSELATGNINTTIAQTAVVNGFWNLASAGQNIQCTASYLRRVRDQ